MNSETIDLRSDTVTVPSRGMREAMALAEVGDDVFGEDPTVNRLQSEAAALFGMEEALLVPSGTMANQLALLTHCRRGDEVLVGRGSHTITHESGGGAVLAGVQIIALDAWVFDGAQVSAAVHAGDIHYAPTTLVMVENSHNRAGGRVFPLETLRSVRAACLHNNLRLHIDGARIFNALAAEGTEPRVLGGLVDSVSFCLSKGLGCPVGSLLLGSAAWVARARRYRKMLGGGMRQAGVLAAAGLYALEHHVHRLVDDHGNAARFAAAIDTIAGVTCPAPETNIVMFDIDPSVMGAAEFQRRASRVGLLLFAVGLGTVRVVFHRDITGDACLRAAELVADVVTGRR